MDTIEKLVKLLINEGKTISTMESCTGGALSSAITNISGSSEIFKFGAVTYSNEYKVKMGVDKKKIDKFTVYSQEVANDMARAVSEFTGSDYGIGVTGKLNSPDKFNMCGNHNVVYISVYCKALESFIKKQISVSKYDRVENKNDVIREVAAIMINLICGNK